MLSFLPSPPPIRPCQVALWSEPVQVRRIVGWAREGRATHLPFGEVAGTEGSFYPLAVSRKHLEKTEGAEKGIRQREGSGPGERRLCGAGKKWGKAGRETHFFTGIFPSGLSCILSFTRLVGQKAACQALGLARLALKAKARQEALTSCPGRYCGGR